MYIYFARSIRGARSPGDKQIQRAIMDQVIRSGHKLTMNAGLPPLEGVFRDTNDFIYQRDLAWLAASHALIAEVTNASHGVGYEIAYAHHVARIPMLIAAEVNTKVSAMIAGGFPVFYYHSVQELERAVDTFLSETSKRQGD